MNTDLFENIMKIKTVVKKKDTSFMFYQLNESKLNNGLYEIDINYEEDEKENSFFKNDKNKTSELIGFNEKVDKNLLLNSEVNKKFNFKHIQMYNKNKELSIIPEDKNDIKYLSSNYKDSNLIKEKSCFGNFFKEIAKKSLKEKINNLEKENFLSTDQDNINKYKEHIMRTKKSISISNNQLMNSKKNEDEKEKIKNIDKKLEMLEKCSIDSQTEVENVNLDLRKNFTLSEITDNIDYQKIPKPQKMETSPREAKLKKKKLIESKLNDKSFQMESKLYEILNNAVKLNNIEKEKIDNSMFNIKNDESDFKNNNSMFNIKKGEKEETEFKKDNSMFNIKKVTLDLIDNSSNEKKRKVPINQTIARLLKNGEDYRSKNHLLQKRKIEEELKNCSFSPIINKNSRKKRNKSMIIQKFSPKQDSILKKNFESIKSQSKINFFLRKNKKNNFISQNILNIKKKHNKLNKNSKIKNKKKSKVIKSFIEPTFKPKINRKSIILAENYRKNSYKLEKKKNKNKKKLLEKEKEKNKFKANQKSDKILSNKLLQDIFETLQTLNIIKNTEEDFGYIKLGKEKFIETCLHLHFFPKTLTFEDIRKLINDKEEKNLREIINNKEEKKIRKKIKKKMDLNLSNNSLISNLSYQEEKLGILINEMWENLKIDNYVNVMSLTIFMLSIYGLYKEYINQMEKDGLEYLPSNNFLKNAPIMFKSFKRNRTSYEKFIKNLKKENQYFGDKKKKLFPYQKKKKEKLAKNYRKKILEKAAGYIKRGLISPPKKQKLEHIDFLILKEKIKEVELNIKRKEKETNSFNECTFKPTINESQISMDTLHYNNSQINDNSFSKSQKSFLNYEKKSAVLKLELKITDSQKEKIFLYANDDVDKKIKKIVQKYKLGKKKTRKLRNLLLNQLQTISD